MDVAITVIPTALKLVRFVFGAEAVEAAEAEVLLLVLLLDLVVDAVVAVFFLAKSKVSLHACNVSCSMLKNSSWAVTFSTVGSGSGTSSSSPYSYS